MSTERTGLLAGADAGTDSEAVPLTSLARSTSKEGKKDKKHKKHAALAEQQEEDGPLIAPDGGAHESGLAVPMGFPGGHAEFAQQQQQQQILSLARSKYDMKNHMANERTFFKYLFTGLHLGSIGTLVLTYFSAQSQGKLVLVTGIWVVAFAFMFWGLYNYYRRKHLMESGQFKDTQHLNPHMPVVVSTLFVGVVALVVAYSAFSHEWPNKNWRALLTVGEPAAHEAAAGGQ